MELRPIDEREKGQVGVGTLIVFIAMVLVAAIAAGVLINTTGFLQSSAEQTGQESSDQVTNIQVATKVGLVAGSGPTDTIVLETPNTNQFAIDSGSTVEVSVTDSDNADLEIDGDSSQLAIQDEDTLTFSEESSSSIQITNERTGAQVSVSPGGSALSITASNGDGTALDAIVLQRTHEDPVNGEVVIQSARIQDSDGTGNSIQAELGDNSEQYMPLTDGSTSLLVDDGQTLVAGSGTDDAAELTPNNGEGSLDIDTGDSVTFEVTADEEITLTNERTGAALSLDPFNSLLTESGDDQEVALETQDGSTSITTGASGGNDFTGLDSSSSPADISSGVSEPALLVNDNYEVAGGGINELNIIAIKGSGADQINMEETTMTTIGPDGTNTLTYSSDGATQGETYAVEAIQDGDDSLPVMTDSDRFRIVVDPGMLETSETMILEVTTESGATTEIRVSVPNTLAGETAVQV